jgi:hypothetical protein
LFGWFHRFGCDLVFVLKTISQKPKTIPQGFLIHFFSDYLDYDFNCLHPRTYSLQDGNAITMGKLLMDTTSITLFWGILIAVSVLLSSFTTIQ